MIKEIGLIPNLPGNTNGVGTGQREDAVYCAPPREEDALSGKL
jgi:hypothetical protein